MPADIEINGQRLWDAIMETARIGGTPKGGICRLTLSDEDREVRDWFRRACEDAGCTVTVDELGNMFARRPGKDNALAPIGIGSHLDTQPTGGKFDGVVGVLSALEVVRTLNDHGIETERPLEVINWTNEEGSRFAPSMIASGTFAGAYTREFAYGRKDAEGRTFGAELERIGYKGTAPCSAREHELASFFEIHIEQGPILEAEDKVIGVVQGVQGMRWYEITVTGQESHSGSTPMAMRRDAGVGAARITDAVYRIAHDNAPHAVGTVGMVQVSPNSRNVIPGRVFLTVDFRHPEEATLVRMEDALNEEVARICGELDLEPAIERISNTPPVEFDPACVAAVRAAAERAGYSWREMISGAGHDAVYVARVAPTSMIFIPCEKGISHAEIENARQDHVTAGANVLLGAVLERDRACRLRGCA